MFATGTAVCNCLSLGQWIWIYEASASNSLFGVEALLGVSLLDWWYTPHCSNSEVAQDHIEKVE
jgi:hypothetical protein